MIERTGSVISSMSVIKFRFLPQLRCAEEGALSAVWRGSDGRRQAISGGGGCPGSKRANRSLVRMHHVKECQRGTKRQSAFGNEAI
jgi:hypothetical protein